MINKLLTYLLLLINPNRALNVAIVNNDLKLARRALHKGAKPTFLQIIVAHNSGDKDLTDTLLHHSSTSQSSDVLSIINSKHYRH